MCHRFGRTLFLQNREALKAWLLLSLEWVVGASRIVLSLERARTFQIQATGFLGDAILKNLEGVRWICSVSCDSTHTHPEPFSRRCYQIDLLSLPLHPHACQSTQLPKYIEAIRDNKWEGYAPAFIFAPNNFIPL